MRYLLVIICLATLCANPLRATHIVGGEITYKCLGQNPSGDYDFQVRLDLYRDCGPASFGFDNLISIYVFDGASNAYVSQLDLPLGPRDTLNITSYDSCYAPPGGLCYEHTFYEGVITLPISQWGYHLSWQRCCRNATIVNISNPLNVGSTFYGFISPTNFCNNSPVFNGQPPTYICLGDTFVFDHGATDVDGDSLFYLITTPFNGGNPGNPVPNPAPPPYVPVTWLSPYSLSNVMGGSPPFSVDPSTGLLTAIPTAGGQFVYSISVFEYRNGVALGEVKRDYQINVMNCPRNNPPEIIPPSGTNVKADTLIFIAEQNNCFSLTIIDQNSAGFGIDSVVVKGLGDIFGGGALVGPYATLADSGLSPLQAQICWAPTCAQVGLIREFYVPAQDNWRCPVPHQVFDTLVAMVIPGDPEAPQVRCVSVVDEGTIEVTWHNPAPDRLAAFNSYNLYRSDGGNWNLIATFSDSLETKYTDFTASSTYTKSYCYRLSTAKDCPTYLDGSPGSEGCSMLIDANYLNQVQSVIDWTPYQVWPDPLYYLYGDSSGIGTLFDIDSLPDTSSIFTQCFFEGRFRVETIDPLTGCHTWSGFSPVRIHKDSIPTPAVICKVSVTGDDDEMEIDWGVSGDNDVILYNLWRKRDDQLDYQMIYSTPNLGEINFHDFEILADSHAYCYKMEFIDLCQNSVYSDPSCSMLLHGSNGPYFTDLNWSAYIGWNSGISGYDIMLTKFVPTPVIVGSSSGSRPSFYHDNIIGDFPEYCYRIAAHESGGCGATSYSNEECFVFPPRLYLPNAFTPNGDGLNDFFEIPNIFVDQFHLLIFDRWGEVIFESFNKHNHWDGNYKGRETAEGVYIYVIEGIGYDGDKLRSQGSVTLYR